MKTSHPFVNAILLPLGIWCLIMGPVVWYLAGPSPFSREHRYTWMQVGVTGLVTIAAAGPLCSKLSRRFGVLCAAALGLLWVAGVTDVLIVYVATDIISGRD